MTIGIVTNPTQLTAAIWVPIFIVACLCVMGITQAAAIGKSIGGSLCTSGGAAMVGGFVGGSMGTWAFSRSSIQKQLSFARQSLGGTASLLQKGKATSQALFKQMHQNMRRGGQ